ncbi:unnamed protein product [Paramecium sonneborni]|uniref:Uncharacterized protein n=1 Tax=Paramecium sonneborni TaxID=65129 RepID=A0A8S1PYJ3_9CILI|nr:unnamed protein product [Paramecium sonneborni]
MGLGLSIIAVIIPAQLFKFDLYNDVIFILNAFNCEENIIFIIALITTVTTQSYFLFMLFSQLAKKLIQSEIQTKILSTKIITEYIRGVFRSECCYFNIT